MKKILLTLTLALVAVALLSSCSKDEYKNALYGTTWEDTESGVTKTMTFTCNFDCTYTLSASNTVDSYVYKYVYDEPNVVITAISTSMADLKGTIIGNTMTLVNTSNDETIGVFTRK